MLHVDQLAGGKLGEYQVERLLVQGQSGAVYLGQHTLRGHPVTITTFNFPAGIAAQARERLNRQLAHEGAILTRLKHHNILPIYACGEQADFAYLVTSFVKVASLAQALKQQVRFTPEQTLSVLRQVAAGLDYAHGNGVVHGVLSLANFLVIDKQHVQITGFGLRTLLDLQGNTQFKQLPAHLFSANGKFLGSPEYVSPERVLGLPMDARSDIYALGVMLFELLSGTPPFSGTDPLEIALMRIQQPSPALHALCPEVPEALDVVVSKAMERDPAQRYDHAGEVAAAFERILHAPGAADQSSAKRTRRLTQDVQITMPPTVNWFDEEMLSQGKWQPKQPADAGGMSAIAPPVMQEQAFQPTQAASNQLIAGVDPFAMWSATAATTESPTPGTFTRRPTVSLASGRARRRPKPGQAERRRLVKVIVVGTVAAGVVGISGISFENFLRSMKQSQSRIANAPGSMQTTQSTQSTQPTQGNTPGAGPTQGTQTQNTPTTGKTPTPEASSTPQPSPTAHSTPTSQPTAKPTPRPTPTPPPHTGTVIGHTSQATNSAITFNNPADGQGSLLIHLSNGNFVACERACTHAGVPVDYDAGSHQIVCPAHGAIFDPLNGFSHLSGPGNGPLATVSIRVNADGTITTG
jgi:serine/threonine protein kinase